MTLIGIFENKPFDFPLKKCDVTVHAVDGVAIVSVVQTYYNNRTERINSYYRFPLYRNGTVNDFNVEFSAGTLQCYIEEVEQAQKTYAEAVEKGKQAALMKENTAEDYDVSIGNINPEETVVVHVQYIVHLERDLETNGRKFILPTTITPRYDNRRKNKNLNSVPHWDTPTLKNPPSLYNRISVQDDTIGNICLNTFQNDKQSNSENHLEQRIAPERNNDDTIAYNDEAENISVNLVMDVVETNGILGLSPPKFDGKIIRKSRVTDNRFTLEINDIDMDKDFVVSVLTDETKPTQLVAWAETFGDVEDDDDGKEDSTCTVKVILPEAQVFNTSRKKIEFIFLIDRSGSMMGQQINNAKRALNLLLNSLPVDCYFNIYGFGSSWKRFYDSSVKYEKEVFHESKQLVERIQADMGGTELNGVLEAIYRTEKIPEYERRIILLTDGEVWDASSIFRIVDTDLDVPIFTIGVGDAVSHELVQGLAERTRGFCETIMDADLIETKVLQQLRRTLYEKTSMEIGNTKVDIRPGQEHLLCVLPESEFPEAREEKADAYLNIIFNDDDESNVIPVHWIIFDDAEEQGEKREQVHPLRLTWAQDQIRNMTNLMDRAQDEKEKEAIRKNIVALSKKYKILTPFTSFVGVLEKEGTEGEEQAATTTVTTPLHPGKYADKTQVKRTKIRTHQSLLLGSRSLLDNRVPTYQQGMQWEDASATSVRNCFGGSAFNSSGGNNSSSRSNMTHTNNYIDLSLYSRQNASQGAMNRGYLDGAVKEDLRDEDEDDEYCSLPKFFELPFENGIDKFMKSVDFDGSISWQILQKYISLPGAPDGCSETVWSTLLFLAFVTVHNKTDDNKYRLLVEKSMSWLTQHNQQGIQPEWYDRALKLMQKNNDDNSNSDCEGSTMKHVFY